MTRIAVTGGSGKAGRATVRDLMDHGYDVTNLDRVESPDPVAPLVVVDLTDPDAVREALSGHDAVVQLAANGEPDWDHLSGAARFHVNTLIAYNVFQAACFLGMKRVVWASSETVLGFPFNEVAPKILPTSDDDPPIPTGSYGISKAVTEDLARHMARRYGVSFVGLRFSNIFYDTPGHVTGYEKIPSFWDDPKSKCSDLWAYVDSRDVAQSVVRSIAADIEGTEVLTIAAADTVMRQTNEELLAAVYPGCRLRPGTGPHDTLISIARARRVLGYEPLYSWRTVLGKP